MIVMNDRLIAAAPELLEASVAGLEAEIESLRAQLIAAQARITYLENDRDTWKSAHADASRIAELIRDRQKRAL